MNCPAFSVKGALNERSEDENLTFPALIAVLRVISFSSQAVITRGSLTVWRCKGCWVKRPDDTAIAFLKVADGTS